MMELHWGAVPMASFRIPYISPYFSFINHNVNPADFERLFLLVMVECGHKAI